MKRFYKWLCEYESVRLSLTILLLCMWRQSGSAVRAFLDGVLFCVYFVPTIIWCYGTIKGWER